MFMAAASICGARETWPSPIRSVWATPFNRSILVIVEASRAWSHWTRMSALQSRPLRFPGGSTACSGSATGVLGSADGVVVVLDPEAGVGSGSVAAGSLH